MKKLISILSSAALMLSMVATPAQAAGVSISASVNTAGAIITVDLPAGVNLAIGDDFTLNLTTTADGNAVDLSGNTATAFTVDGNDESGQLTNTGDANGDIVVTSLAADPADGGDVVVTLTSALTDDTSYTISYVDSQDNFGAAVFSVDTGSDGGVDNEVTVTATVEPTLTMTVTNTSIDLGTLSSGSVTSSSTDTNVAVTTNSSSGFNIQAAATDFTGASTGDVIAFAASSAAAAGTESFSVDASVNTAISSGDGTLSIDEGFDNDTTSDLAISNSAQTIASSDGTAGDGSVDVNYSAAISATTAADTYSTTVTYTVTGSF